MKVFWTSEAVRTFDAIMDYLEKQFSEKQKEIILSGIKNMRNQSGFKFFIENNVTFSYNYDDKNGENLLKISIPPSEYK